MVGWWLLRLSDSLLLYGLSGPGVLGAEAILSVRFDSWLLFYVVPCDFGGSHPVLCGV